MRTYQASVYFIRPLCVKVLVLIELLFNHIMSERENKIVELEKSKYTIGAVLDRFPTSLPRASGLGTPLVRSEKNVNH